MKTTLKIVKDKDGKPRKSKDGKHIFTKEGVYFALSKEDMKQMKVLIQELESGFR